MSGGISEGYHPVYFDQGAQPLVHVPGVMPALATFEIADMSVDEDSPLRILAEGEATRDGLSEVTVGSVAGPRASNPRRLPITGSEAIAGRIYRIVSSEDGTSQLVRVESVTATSVLLTGTLSAEYPVGSQLLGAEIRGTFPADAAARAELQEEERVLRVRWTYEAGGISRPVSEQVRLVRDESELASWVTTVELRLREDWQELVHQLGGGPSSLRALALSCARDVSSTMRAMGFEPEGLFLGDQGLELLVRRCVYRFGELGHCPKSREIERWADQQRIHWLSLAKGVANGGGSRTAERDTASDTATKNRRTKKRYITRSA